jgi:hypothetical protein
VSAPGRQQEPSDIHSTETIEVTEQRGEAAGDSPKPWVEDLTMILTLLVVIGLGALAGWAVMLVFKSLMQALVLMVQNGFVFHR